MPSSSPEHKPRKAAREAEYQALWQVCDRAARRPQFLFADEVSKRAILEEACETIMMKRRNQGKDYCGTDLQSMVNLHIQREATGRILANVRMGAATPSPGAMPFLGNGAAFNATPAPFPANPSPFNGNPSPFSAGPSPFNGNPTAYNGSQAAFSGTQAAYNSTQAAYNAILQSQPRVSPPSDLDFSIPKANPVHQELNRHEETMQKVINTLRDYDRRIATLEGELKEITQERDMLKAEVMKADMRAATVPPGLINYPIEGIEGFKAVAGVAYSLPRPLTPRSQTQGRDEDNTEGTYQPGM
ncbi:hypothetical protein IL306_002369 [Fusarium sp. DS 682]|nr:hypothetical protein IL306_002369 [Fusarium sp. DS 682]